MKTIRKITSTPIGIYLLGWFVFWGVSGLTGGELAKVLPGNAIAFLFWVGLIVFVLISYFRNKPKDPK